MGRSSEAEEKCKKTNHHHHHRRRRHHPCCCIGSQLESHHSHYGEVMFEVAHLRDGTSWSGVEWLSRDGNFIGLFTIPSSTANKMSAYHSSFFQQRLWTRSATFLNVFKMLSTTSNTSSFTPRSFRRPFTESHNSYCICNATWQQLKLTTGCIHIWLGLPISCCQLKAESWTAGSPVHKTQWQVDARIYTQPWTATKNCQNSNGMSWVSQILTWETNWYYMRRAASILRIAKREQFGTAKDQSPVCQ